MKRWALLTALFALLAPSSALASDSAAEAVSAIDAAVAAESSAPEAELVQDGGAVAPEVGSDPVSLGDGLQLGIPASGDAQTINGTTVFDAETTNDAQVAVQQASGGIRALVKIDSENAPERYDFPVSGNVSRLEHESDGSVTARDATGAQVGSFAPAWARDGLGRSVPTHYEIAGTTLTQVVDHQGGGYDYAVVADPWWVPVSVAIVRCQANRYCRKLMNKSFWRGVKWALENLF